MSIKFLFSLIILGGITGCVTTPADWGKYRGVPHAHPTSLINNERFSEEELADPQLKSKIEIEARALGLRYVDYLHGVNSNKIRRTPTLYYQAYDSKWDDPTINPVFETQSEAEEYARRNNMSSQGFKAEDGSHSYIVREVDYRYEVRQQNDAVNDILHTSPLLNDVKKYVKEYESSHMDLHIYDLQTGHRIEVDKK